MILKIEKNISANGNSASRVRYQSISLRKCFCVKATVISTIVKCITILLKIVDNIDLIMK